MRVPQTERQLLASRQYSDLFLTWWGETSELRVMLPVFAGSLVKARPSIRQLRSTAYEKRDLFSPAHGLDLFQESLLVFRVCIGVGRYDPETILLNPCILFANERENFRNGLEYDGVRLRL